MIFFTVPYNSSKQWFSNLQVYMSLFHVADLQLDYI